MNTYVFVGPSVRVEEARQMLDAIYLPPAVMGDVYRVTCLKPSAILIIDGCFEQVPAVWHKEILYALESGIRVVGASSMGALRAAELAHFGMEGVGEIFEAYQQGILEDDDEVAVIHAPASQGYRPLSEAMVNLRHGLGRARDRGVLSAASHDALVADAKATFYAERSWERLWSRAAGLGLSAAEVSAAKALVARERPNLKRDDAIAALRRVSESAGTPAVDFKPAFQMERTAFWGDLVATAGAVGPQIEINDDRLTYEEVRDHLRITIPDLEQRRRACLLLHLLDLEATRRGYRIDPVRIQEASEQFRRSRGLLTASATRAWLEDNGMSKNDFGRLLELEVLAEDFLRIHTDAVDNLLVHELRRTDEFSPILQALTEKKRLLRQRGIVNPTLADTEAELGDVLNWYRGHVRPIESSLKTHALSLGFESLRMFLSNLLAEYIYDHHVMKQEESIYGSSS